MSEEPKSRPSENYLVDFCTSALLKAQVFRVTEVDFRNFSYGLNLRLRLNFCVKSPFLTEEIDKQISSLARNLLSYFFLATT